VTQIKSITDDEFVEQFRSGKFIGQICREHHVGLRRVRAVLDRAGLRSGEVAG